MTTQTTHPPSGDRDYQRVQTAIEFIQAHVKDQPSLTDIATAVGLSEFHFQRLFKRWAGVSPKRYLQFLTIDHAKHALHAGSSILESSYETGLSGPSRLHDLFIAVDAVTPGEFKERGAGVDIYCGIHPTPFGECLLATTPRGICHLAFVTSTRGRALSDLQARWPQATVREDRESTRDTVTRIFRPDAEPSQVTLFLHGTNFQLKVWEALLRVPPGTLISYEALAAHLGRPSAVRAVGTAVGRNPIAYLIPCHRVIRKSGALGGYHWGGTRKRAIVGWEAARAHAHAASA